MVVCSQVRWWFAFTDVRLVVAQDAFDQVDDFGGSAVEVVLDVELSSCFSVAEVVG